jgi:hypothetical protein
MKIDGPYSHKTIDGLKVPIYIFAPGAVRVEIGEVTVKSGEGLAFDVVLEAPYANIDTASFEIPMRFVIDNREEEVT